MGKITIPSKSLLLRSVSSSASSGRNLRAPLGPAIASSSWSTTTWTFGPMLTNALQSAERRSIWDQSYNDLCRCSNPMSPSGGFRTFPCTGLERQGYAVRGRNSRGGAICPEGPFADMTAAHRGRARWPLLTVSGGWRHDPPGQHVCPCLVVFRPSGELQYPESPQVCQLTN